ncbi:MAG: YczE/YyaS/YitT family protein [Frankiaceae bacterium]
MGGVLLATVPPDRRPQRAVRLLVGLVLYGISTGLLVLAGLGLAPWDVLHQGLSRALGMQVGTWTIIVSGVVLLGWIPLRQRVGVGTLANAVVVGLVTNAVLALAPSPHGLPARLGVMLGAVALNGMATGLYIGAGLGPGPRDGLMTGIAARGPSIRVVRTGMEVTVLVAGWFLGGTVGIGTVVYALAIGPMVHLTIPWLALAARSRFPAPCAETTTA